MAIDILQNTTLPKAIISGVSDEDFPTSVVAKDSTIPVVYGKFMVNGKIGPIAVDSDLDLIVCFFLCWGEVDSIESVYVNDEALSATYYTAYTGTTSQGVDPTLAANFTNYGASSPEDKHKHILTIGNETRGLAYVVCEIPPGLVTGFPRLSAIVKGMKVYNPAVSSHVYGTRSSYEYSQTPALCLGDFLDSTLYGAGASVNWDSVESVANDNDTIVDPGHPHRRIGLTLESPKKTAEWIENLRTYAGCMVLNDGSTKKLVSDKVTSTSSTYNKDDIVEGSIKLSKKGSSAFPTVVRVEYTDINSIPWKTLSALVKNAGVDTGAEPWRESVVYLPGIKRYAQAFREATERLNAANLTDLECRLTVFDEALENQEGDVIEITHPIGLTSKKFRVLKNKAKAAGRWAFELYEYDPAVYDDSVQSEPTYPDTTLPDPKDLPTVTNVSASESLYQDPDGTWKSRLNITWDSITYFNADWKFIVKVTYGGSVFYETSTLANNIITPPVESDGVIEYTAEVWVESSQGWTGTSDTDTNIPDGNQDNPSSAGAVTATYSQGSILAAWSSTGDTDTWLYEIRYDDSSSPSWAGATPWDTTNALTTTINTVLEGISSGTVRIYVKAINSVGNFSAAEVYDDVVVDTSDIPEDGAETNVSLHNLPVDTPSGSGLFMDATHLGYYNSPNWMTYMDSSGNFYLGGTSGALQWDGSNLAIVGSITLTNNITTPVAAEKIEASAVVDVFLYDTSKDSDGGVWRERCQNLSWYNETLNTTTRGATRKFPAIALIVAKDDTVTIYDATDVDLPMWMVFDDGINNILQATGSSGLTNIVSVTMLNGLLLVCRDTGDGRGLYSINFLADKGEQYNTPGLRSYLGIISERSDSKEFGSYSGDGIVSIYCNDVAITVLPTAPTDQATGLPVPTIAVATDGGVSVITDGGDIWDITTAGDFDAVDFTGDRLLSMREITSPMAYIGDIPTADIADTVYRALSDTAYINSGGFGNIDIPDDDNLSAVSINASMIALGYTPNAGDGGLRLFHIDQNSPANSMVNYITKDYQSGWMQGDIRRAFLANSKTADRSVKGATLVETGTVTEAAVATGAELKGYSGFSVANYFTEVYSADLDFGTGDFHIMGWLKGTDTTGILLQRHEGATDTKRITVDVNSSLVRFYFESGTGITSSISLATTDIWLFVVASRVSGTLSIYINGAQEGTPGSSSLNLTSTIATLGIGCHGDTTNNYTGSLALWRMGAGSPTAEQIEYIYNTEKHLFQENADCTLGDSVSTVKALSYDEATQTLNVGTNNGISQFKDLIRTDYVSSEVGTMASVSAYKNILLTGGSTGAYADIPEYSVYQFYSDLDPVSKSINPTSYSFGPVGEDGLNFNTIAPEGEGLYLGSNALGFHNGTDWKTYMDSSGNFYLGGASGKLQWNGSTLTVEGNITNTGGVLDADYITAGTLTGRTIQTAASGKRFIVTSSTNEGEFWGDRGDSTIEKLATIGISDYGGDNVIGYFGTGSADLIAVVGLNNSANTTAIFYNQGNGNGIDVITTGVTSSGVHVSSNGYAFYAQNGVCSFKNVAIRTGYTITIDGNEVLTEVTADYVTLTNNSMADTKHRHSELSASDGSPDAAFQCDVDGHLLPAADVTYNHGSDAYRIKEITAENFETNAAGVTIKNASGSVNCSLYRTTTTIVDNDPLGYFRFRGYNGSGAGTGALILAYATENWSVGNQGCELRFNTNDDGESGAFGTTRMTIKNDGVINIANIPTSASGLVSGDIWSDGGTLKIVA